MDAKPTCTARSTEKRCLNYEKAQITTTTQVARDGSALQPLVSTQTARTLAQLRQAATVPVYRSKVAQPSSSLDQPVTASASVKHPSMLACPEKMARTSSGSTKRTLMWMHALIFCKLLATKCRGCIISGHPPAVGDLATIGGFPFCSGVWMDHSPASFVRKCG